MVVQSHKITRFIDVNEFLDSIKDKNIELSKHALFRLGDKQRDIFKEEIPNYIKNKTPVCVGIQGNGLYAIFYKYSSNLAIRILLISENTKVLIVTFYIISMDKIPTQK